jgi:hypothetical protein
MTGLTIIALAALVFTLINLYNNKVNLAVPVLLLCILELVRSAVSIGGVR